MDAHAAACRPQDAQTDIDWQELLESVGADPTVLREVVQAYADEITSELARLQGSLASGDLTTAEKSSHKLKSAVRFFRQESTAAQAEQVEDAAEHGDHDAAAIALAEITPRVEQLLGVVAGWLG